MFCDTSVRADVKTAVSQWVNLA